jgi:hypothetical protein
VLENVLAATAAMATTPNRDLSPTFSPQTGVGCGGDGEISPNVEGNDDESE